MIDVKVVGLDVATSLLEIIEPEKLAKELVENLAEMGAELAREHLRSQPFGSYPSELEQSIRYEVKHNKSMAKAIISADAGFAAYVEYGTGIVGKNSPSPNASIKGIVYDRNNHGEKGWKYFKNGKFRWTRGQTSKPFMYETAQSLLKLVHPTVSMLIAKRFPKKKSRFGK